MKQRRSITCEIIDELLSIASSGHQSIDSILTNVGRYTVDIIGQSYQANRLVTYGEIIEWFSPTIFSMMDQQNA